MLLCHCVTLRLLRLLRMLLCCWIWRGIILRHGRQHRGKLQCTLLIATPVQLDDSFLVSAGLTEQIVVHVNGGITRPVEACGVSAAAGRAALSECPAGIDD